LAGASQPIGLGVVNVMKFAGVDLSTAVDMASLRPLELIGHTPHRLEVGAPANFIVFRIAANEPKEPCQILATVNRGDTVYQVAR
jgi:N-acetylglucosamine-6-phosphate deacetylase